MSTRNSYPVSGESVSVLQARGGGGVVKAVPRHLHNKKNNNSSLQTSNVNTLRNNSAASVHSNASIRNLKGEELETAAREVHTTLQVTSIEPAKPPNMGPAQSNGDIIQVGGSQIGVSNIGGSPYNLKN